MSAPPFPPLHEIIPHRGEVLLLDRVLDHGDAGTSARVVVASQSWLTQEDGSVAGWVALEYMAQCVAAHEGMVALLEGRPIVGGLLVGAVGVHLHRTRFESDEVLRVRANRARGRPGLGVLSHRCEVYSEDGTGGGSLLAEGRLSVVIQPPSETATETPAI